MCADAGFHADQATRYIGEPRYHLATRPLLPQHDGAARIVAYDVERVLADVDADHGDRGIGCLRHGVLLVFGAPRQLRSLAGPEHGRTIPLADVGCLAASFGLDGRKSYRELWLESLYSAHRLSRGTAPHDRE